MLSGCCFGVASALVGMLCLAMMEAFLPKALWGTSAAASIAGLSNGGLFFVAVLWIPFFETFIGQLLPIEVSRRIGLNRVFCVLVSAATFALGHYLNGGLAHGISTFFGGAIFSSAYMTMRAYGYWPAYLSSCTAHMTHNCLFLFVVPLLIPKFA
jgi:hypothetical protein